MMEAHLPGQYDHVVHGFHAATGVTGEWPGAMEALRAALGGRAAVLACHDFRSGRGAWLWESPLDLVGAAYGAEPSRRNPWFISSLDYEPGRVMTGDELLQPKALERTDYYRHHLQPLGLFHRLCGVLARRDEKVWYVDVLRARADAPFERAEKALFEAVLRHVSLALQNHWRLEGQRDENRTLRAAFDHLAHAVLVADAGSSVLLANERARSLLAESRALSLVDGRLVAGTRADSRALGDAVAAAATTPPGSAPPRILLLHDASAAPPGATEPLVLAIRPAGAGLAGAAGAVDGVALVTVKGPRCGHDTEHCVFPRLFDLTPAQARLALLVVAGYSLAAAAERLQVSENTVRSHLKQVYLKTDTHGQIELVHLHARVCPDHL